MKKILLSFLWVLIMIGSHAYAQNRTITGTVTGSDDGQPLPGVSITIKGTTTGTQTAVNGKFSIVVPSSRSTLVFSFVGYERREVSSTSSNLNVALTPAANQLNEVVVVGYGTQERRELTGSVGKVQGADLANKPAPSFDRELAGRVTGVRVTEASGLLGVAPTIRVRGDNSLSSGTDPLYVLDGVPIITGNQSGVMANNPLADINPADILSVDVLKDGSASAIYGSRAANGVVLITTRKGKAGKTTVNYNVWMGQTETAKRLKVLDADQFITLSNEKFTNAGLAPVAFPTLDASGKPYDTDWQDVVFRKAFQQNHDVSLSGGTETSTYFFSGGFSDFKGNIVDNSLRKYTMRASLEQKALNNALTLGFNSGISYTAGTGLNTNTNALSSNVATSLLLFPNVGVYNNDGSINFSSDGAKLGPGANTRQIDNNYTNIKYVLDNNIFRNQNLTLNGTAFADAKIASGLHVRSQIGINSLYGEDYQYWNPLHGDGRGSNGLGIQQYIPTFNYVWTNTLNYNKTVGSHTFGFVAGAEYQRTRQRSFFAQGTNLSNTFFGPNNIISNTFGTPVIGGDEVENSIKSYFGRLNYNYKEKYLLSVTYRTDYLSSLGPNGKPGHFPGASAGWRISQEDFFKNSRALSFINDLKLRGSLARTGNANIGYYPFASSYAPATYGTQSGINFSRLGNPALKYETVDKADIGLDLTTLHSRLTFTADVYRNNDNNLVLNVPIAPSLGVPGNVIAENIGNMYNKGIELGISSRNIVSKDFSWTTDFNFSYNKNEITKLYQNQDVIGTYNILRVGQPKNAFFGYKYAGVNPANGFPLYYKANGQMIQGNVANATYYLYDPANPSVATTQSSLTASDKVVLGNAIPTYFGGFNNTFNFKQFDLNVYFTYSGGNKINNVTRQETLDTQLFDNNGVEMLQRWTTPGQVTNVPKQYYGNGSFINVTGSTVSRYLEDGKFIRAQTITLGYSLPKDLVGRLNLSRVHIYAQVQNAFVITKYKGVDPEISNVTVNGTSAGIDFNANPRPRTFVAGLNVAF